MAKGSVFEREVCRELSLWYSNGEHDDLFWRSSTSGARATTRAKAGKRTVGHCGDIAATSEEGAALLKVVTIELKRGYNTHTPLDLLDGNGSECKSFARMVDQAKAAAARAKTPWWWLIHRRDKRKAVLYMPAKLLKVAGVLFSKIPAISTNLPDKDHIGGILVSDFFDLVSPLNFERNAASEHARSPRPL